MSQYQKTQEFIAQAFENQDWLSNDTPDSTWVHHSTIFTACQVEIYMTPEGTCILGVDESYFELPREIVLEEIDAFFGEVL